MIPRKIHYIWFGGVKPNSLNTAIRTWKKHASNYSIIEWNEKNLPYFNNSFYREALNKKNYAFASDYARLKILEKYGGVYIDTDMYLLDEIDPVLRNRELVFGILNEDYIFSTSLIASIPNQNFIKRALEVYNGLSYEQGHKIPNTVLLSPLMSNMYNFAKKDITQKREDNKVIAYNSNILLQPSFNAVALHIGEKTWASHTKHDRLRIKTRKHIKNQFSAGIFRIVNDLFRNFL